MLTLRRSNHRSLRRTATVVTATLLAALLSACGGGDGGGDSITPPPSDTGHTGGNAATPVAGVTATAVSSSSIRVSFTSRAGDNSYTVERAEGTGSFSGVGSVTAPVSASTVSYTDVGLKASTAYRYRVLTLFGNVTSSPSSEASATTLAAAPGAADITTDITASRTLRADTTYTLKGFIHVANGATLTIEPGTTIKGDYATPGSSLFILRGARILANGTAAQPIVFTSSRPAGSRQPGDWGGLVIVGNAPDSRTGAVALDGTGTDGTTVASGKNYQVLYSGGATPTDNSGSLSYIRVEFAGFAPTADNELNAFTFATVGSGTHVSYLQALASLDDAFEFFGGALDGDHLVAYETGDDMFDLSEGFTGRLQYLIGFNSLPLTPRAGFAATSNDVSGIESDGCFGSGCDNGFNQQPLTVPLVSNFTLVGCGLQSCSGAAGGFGVMLRRGTGGYYINGVVSRFPAAGISLRDLETFQRGGSVITPSLATSDLLIRNLHFSEVSGTIFQINTTSTPTQFTLDLATNSLTNGVSISQSLFTSLPTPGTIPSSVSALDWTPAPSAPIGGGGMASFSGRILTKSGSYVTPTPYLGAAAPGGAKWWASWTTYVRN